MKMDIKINVGRDGRPRERVARCCPDEIHDDGEDTSVWAPAAVIAARKYVVGKKRAVGLHLERRDGDEVHELKSFKKFVKRLGIEVSSDIERAVRSASAKAAILGTFELSK